MRPYRPRRPGAASHEATTHERRTGLATDVAGHSESEQWQRDRIRRCHRGRQGHRNRRRRGTLMRHYLPGAIAALPRCVGETTAARGLIAPAGRPHRLPPGIGGASAAAIPIAAIAARTDDPQLAAADTGEQSSDRIHRQFPAETLDLLPPAAGYSTRVPCLARCGCGTGADLAVSTQCRIVLIGAACLR